MNEFEVFRQRRRSYQEMIGPRAVAVLPSWPEAVRNGDCHFSYRQSSDLYYLTGLAEPSSTLVLCPGREEGEAILFVRPRDPERETWTGRRIGTAGAVDLLGVDAAFPASELEERLGDLIANCEHLYYPFGIDPQFDAIMTRILGQLRRQQRKRLAPPRAVYDPSFALHEMRLRKSESELAVLRRAGEITAEAFLAAMKCAAPGVSEHEIAATIDYTFRRLGGMGPGYETICGSGENATILHYVDNNRIMKDGDLLLIDAGCELDYYTADVTRTFPVSGKFTPVQKHLYEVVLRAEEESIERVGPGVTVDSIHDECVRILTEGMVDLGLLSGSVDELIETEAYKRFYMHRTSHWLGMDVHDVGMYYQGTESRALEPGMVITIEPGIYVAADAEDVPDELRGQGVRIEDDVAVTATGHEVLTPAVPKSVADVEAACAG